LEKFEVLEEENKLLKSANTKLRETSSSSRPMAGVLSNTDEPEAKDGERIFTSIFSHYSKQAQ